MTKLQILLAAAAWVSIGTTFSYADGTWTATSAGNWSTPGNWAGGVVPGTTTVTGDTETATFNTATGVTVTVDTAIRNVQNITFDTNVGSFIIGASGGTNTLALTAGGQVQIASTVTSTGKTETIRAPITLGGNYTFANNSTTTTPDTLSFTGAIGSGATSGTTTLALTTAAVESNTISGAISDGSGTNTVALSETAAGTWILAGSNTYSGGTTVNSGTLQVGASNGTAGTLGSGSVSIATGSTLVFARVDNAGYTVANTITGGGVLTKSGTGGLLFLTGANSYTGATNVNAGILNIQNATALGTTAAGTTVANGATLQLQGGITVGAEALNLVGAGATTGGASATGALENVSGTNNYGGLVKLAGTGATSATISSDAGTLNLTNTGTIAGSGFALTLTGAGNGSIASIIGTGTGTVTKSGAGTWSLSGANTYTGATTVGGGTLVLTGSTNVGSAVTVGNNSAATAILSGGGTINGSLTTATTGSNVAYLAPGVNTSGARGDFGSAGTLHVGSAGVTLGNGTELDIDLATTATIGNSDLLAMSGGTLTLGTNGTLTVDYNMLGSSLATGTAYTLISGATTVNNFNSGNITTLGLTGYTAAYSVVSGALDVTFTATSAPAAYFNGAGNDLNTAGDYNTTVSSGVANTVAPSGTTNVFFSANGNTLTSATLSAPLAVNSVNFGAGTGTKSGITVSGSSALTINGTNANGNTTGNGITIATGGGSDTISAPVVLGGTQTWTSTDASSTLTVSGQVSGAHSLTTAGAGAVVLNNASGNIYSGGTTVGSGTFYANNAGGATYSAPTSNGRNIVLNNTSNSATGSGTVTVTGGTLAGKGTIAPGAGSGGVVVQSGGNLASGGVQSNAAPYAASPGLSINNAAGLSSVLAVNAGAELTFALGAGTGGTFANPNTNSSYLTVAGNTAGEINFTNTTSGSGAITINLVDLTTGAPTGTTLALRQSSPYLLIQAGSDSDYDLITSLNGVLSVNGNGYVVGVGTSTSSYNSAAFELQVTALGGVTPLNDGTNYQGLQLYLQNGDLEVVPEPGTWALMLGGLALLVGLQRRQNKWT
jgi:fibronectin-binding autotransporter adhesin